MCTKKHSETNVQQKAECIMHEFHSLSKKHLGIVAFNSPNLKQNIALSS